MSKFERPSEQVRPRRQYLHEIEFFDNVTVSRFDMGESHHEKCIRARLLDPRLQRIVAAAANGWVVERLR